MLPNVLTQPMPAIDTGFLKSLNPGKFGFVITSQGDEAIFTPMDCPGSTELVPGDPVVYVLLHSAKGKRAKNVRKLRPQGTVLRYNPAQFGFILTSEGEQALFNTSNILPGHFVREGDMVEFDLLVTPKGKQAKNISRVSAISNQSPLIFPPYNIDPQPRPISAVTPNGINFRPNNTSSPPPGTPIETGYVKSFNEVTGFGFVIMTDGSEALVHRNHLIGATMLSPADMVEFVVQNTAKGKKATHVRKLGTAVAQIGGVPGTFTLQESQREVGTVKSFNPGRGMGFIYTPQGEEALVTINNVIDQKPLVAAEMVEYEVIVSAKGKRAVNVSRVNGRFQPYYGFVSQ